MKQKTDGDVKHWSYKYLQCMYSSVGVTMLSVATESHHHYEIISFWACTWGCFAVPFSWYALREHSVERKYSWMNLTFFFPVTSFYHTSYLPTCYWIAVLKMSPWNLIVHLNLPARICLFWSKNLVDCTWFKAPKLVVINSLCCLMLAFYVPDLTVLTVWAQWKTRQ